MSKKTGVLFTGGKDSCYALLLAKKAGHEISCLITIVSENQDSFMFHTPSISQVKKQAQVLNLPLIIQKTKGEKEKELVDLESAINQAKKEYKIEGIVTGALESVYQKSRIQEICKKLGIECINPLWKKDQIELLKELLENQFEVIITGVAAYPLDETWIGRKIDENFIKEVKLLNEKYGINPAGEGGEFETLVLNCPLFSKKLEISSKKVLGGKHSFRMDVVLN